MAAHVAVLRGRRRLMTCDMMMQGKIVIIRGTVRRFLYPVCRSGTNGSDFSEGRYGSRISNLKALPSHVTRVTPNDKSQMSGIKEF